MKKDMAAQESQNNIILTIVELLETACQAGLELLEHYLAGEMEAATGLLRDLRAVSRAVIDAQQPLLPRLEYACTSEMLENIEDTLDDIERAVQAGNSDRAAMKMEFQLFPFLRQLREGFYFWGAIYPEKAEMERYYREEFAAHYQNLYLPEDDVFPVRLSIAVTGYNHLETTKKCVAQLLKETDFEKLNAELLLIDHGSTDGTLEYFESLGVGKVIRFKRNVRMYMFSILPQICRGKYFCFVSNDILVTRDWAEILLQCLESDPRVIAAVPATPNISNLQMLNPPTNDPGEFIAWANGQNRSDPSRWSDRARLMPPLGMYQTRAVSEIGFADPYFYSMEFWDDDFSLRARRAGYRQVVCADVACYHFGSVTGKEGQIKEGTLNYGRELFRNKNGVDAWGTGFCYDFRAVQLLLNALPPQGDLSMLGIDCGMGDTPLQVRNEMRRVHRGCRLCQLTGQKQYLPDLKPFSETAFSPALAEGAATAFGTQSFSCAYIGRDIGQYEDCVSLLAAVRDRLMPGGCLVFSCANPFFVLTIHQMLQLALPENAARYVCANPELVYQAASRLFSKVTLFKSEEEVGGLKEFVTQHYGESSSLSHIMAQLPISSYYYLCIK